MSIPAPLGLKVDALIVLHPSERERAGAVDPRVVVFVDDHPGLAGSRIERQHPSVFVVAGASRDDGLCSVLGPNWLRELNLAFARFVGPAALPASPAGLRSTTFAFGLIGGSL